jgi:hypothetical protein
MRRSVIALLFVPVLLMATPSSAASRGELHAKEMSGDANGLNSQGIGLPIPATATPPVSLAGADITRLDVVTRYRTVKGKRIPRATVVTLSLAGPVQAGVNFVITANVGGGGTCDDTNKRIQLGYQVVGSQYESALAICQTPSATNSETIGYLEVDAAKGKISWVLEMGQKPGHTLTDFAVSSTVFVAGVFDEFNPRGTFTYAR